MDKFDILNDELENARNDRDQAKAFYNNLRNCTTPPVLVDVEYESLRIKAYSVVITTESNYQNTYQKFLDFIYSELK